MASGSVHPFCLFIDILNTRDASLAINYELKWSHKKLATTGKSFANKKVPLSQIDVSLLANLGCFLEKKKQTFGQNNAFQPNVKTAISL